MTHHDGCGDVSSRTGSLNRKANPYFLKSGCLPDFAA